MAVTRQGTWRSGGTAAAAILDALDAGAARALRGSSGEDALRHAREHFEMLEAEMRKWEVLSLSTAHTE